MSLFGGTVKPLLRVRLGSQMQRERHEAWMKDSEKKGKREEARVKQTKRKGYNEINQRGT